MSRDIVYFDLETQRTANDVGGWDKKRDMGMSLGVTYSTRLGEYRIFSEKRVDDLVDQLLRADLVVGFNVVNFDYEVDHVKADDEVGAQELVHEIVHAL